MLTVSIYLTGSAGRMMYWFSGNTESANHTIEMAAMDGTRHNVFADNIQNWRWTTAYTLVTDAQGIVSLPDL